MSDKSAVMAEVDGFLGQWPDEPMRECFIKMYRNVAEMAGVELEFVSRPKISHSLRPKHVNQSDRDLFGMIDVIDDDPEARWLSVCFYGDLITDPEERGELIPGGLAGADGYCFDMYEADDELTGYIIARLQEASVKAAE